MFYNLNLGDGWFTGPMTIYDVNAGTPQVYRERRVEAFYRGQWVCRECGSFGRPTAEGLKVHERKMVTIRDSPDDMPRVIHVERLRLRCPHCKKSTWQRFVGEDPAHEMTTRCRTYIEQRALRRHTATSIAYEIGFDPETPIRVTWDLVSRMNRGRRIAAPMILGVDEKTIAGEYRLVLTALPMKNVDDADTERQQSVLLDILPDNDQPTFRRWLLRLPDRDKIQFVAMDGHYGYREVIQSVLPKAVVVLDRWHLEQYLLARTTNRKIKDKAAEARKFFKLETRAEAESALVTWVASLDDAEKIIFDTFLNFWRSWRNEVLAYWDTRISNAGTEQKNGVLALLIWLGRGSRFDLIRGKALNNDRKVETLFSCSKCLALCEEEDQVLGSAAYEFSGTDTENELDYMRRHFEGKAVPITLLSLCRTCAGEGERPGYTRIVESYEPYRSGHGDDWDKDSLSWPPPAWGMPDPAPSLMVPGLSATVHVMPPPLVPGPTMGLKKPKGG